MIVAWHQCPLPRLTLGVLLAVVLTMQAAAQGHAVVLESIRTSILDLDHPRLAFADDGSYAVAFEILTQEQFESQPVRKVAVQRFAASGVRLGPTHVFKGESCSSLDMWLFDYMLHPEIAFRSDGILLVMMQHSGRFVIGSDDVGASEVTIAAIDLTGQIIDLNNSGACVQHKVIFVGGGRSQNRPRMALSPDNAIMLTADGFFNRSDYRSVGIRVLSPDLSTVFEQGVPHADVMAQSSFHVYPDIATNGTLALSTWHRCPVIDNQGNANECAVEAQFITSPISGSPQTLGGNITVTQGAPPGTVSIWPSVAMNASGASVVVWADTRNSPLGEVFGQRFDAAGQPVGSNFQVSGGQGAIYFRPEVALLDDGRFMAVWTDSSSTGFSARGRQFGGDGLAFGSPVLLSEGSGLQSGRPTVASTGSGFETIWLAGSPGESPAAYTSHSGIVTSTDEGVVPADPGFELYPNPVRSEAILRVMTPGIEDVSIAVFDLLGRHVRSRVVEARSAGTMEITLDTSNLAPGVYAVRIKAGHRTQTRFMTVIP